MKSSTRTPLKWRKKVSCFFSAGLFAIILVIPAAGKSQETAYEKINRIIHEKSWYEGCPKCRNLFDVAFKEVEKGSAEWEKLVEYYTGCLMEEHREIEAINFLQEALKISPRNYRFLSGIGTAYMRMQNDEKAEEFFIKSNVIEPNRDAYYKLAFIHYKKGARISSRDEWEKRNKLLKKAEEEVKEAIELYKTRTHVSPYASTANLSLLAHIYSAQGRTEEAINIYKECINIAEKAQNWDPKRKLFAITEFKFSLGQLLFRSGRKDEGIKLMKEAIEVAPTENLKKIKRILLDITLHPPKNKDELQARYPQLKGGSFIPLY